MIMPHQKPHSSSAPPEIHGGLASFYYQYPQTMAVGFVMMSFRNGDEQAMIRKALGIVRNETGVPLLTVDADDRTYHGGLLRNIMVYMHGCAFGVAFFDSGPANPNVALETGYMIGMGKPVLLMKSEPLAALQSDLIGRLYVPYDPTATSSKLAERIASWVRANILVRADDSAAIAHGSVQMLLQELLPGRAVEDSRPGHLDDHVEGLRKYLRGGTIGAVRALLMETAGARAELTRDTYLANATAEIAYALALRHPDYLDKPFWKEATRMRIREVASRMPFAGS